jgi:hypothetical protein
MWCQDLLREHAITVSLRTHSGACGRAAAPSVAGRGAGLPAFRETPPGKQLQIDFGPITVPIGGTAVRVHLFVATLGYLRRPFVWAFRHER